MGRSLDSPSASLNLDDDFLPGDGSLLSPTFPLGCLPRSRLAGTPTTEIRLRQLTQTLSEPTNQITGEAPPQDAGFRHGPTHAYAYEEEIGCRLPGSQNPAEGTTVDDRSAASKPLIECHQVEGFVSQVVVGE